VNYNPASFAQEVAEEIMELPGIRDLPYKHTVLMGVELGVLLLCYLAVRAILRRVVRQGTEVIAARAESAGNPSRAGRMRALSQISTGATLWIVSFLFIVAALGTVGINVAPILGTASVVGIAVGLGAQKLAKDMLTGFFILLEDQYVVGDYVTINGVTGSVEQLGIRTSTLRDDEGKIYILSNGDIGQVCNHSRGSVAGSFEIPIAASASPEQAMKVLQDAFDAQFHELGLTEAPRILGISALDAAKTVIKIGYNAPPNHRPGPYAPQLREAARVALLKAEIPLGGP
jgi:small conductance mechanosensitive channel